LLPGNYIVRIYRKGKDDTRLVVGIVEEVGVREKKGFHCIEELRIILDLPPGRPIRQPRNGGNGGNDRNRITVKTRTPREEP
jgi:hypothetical protein